MLKKKLAGELYDDMTDSDGNPVPKPDNDIGIKLQESRAKRNRIIPITAGKGTGGLLFVTSIKFEGKFIPEII